MTDNGEPAANAERSFQVSVTGALEMLSAVRKGGQLEIAWRTIPGRSYRLVRSGTLPAAQWTAVPGDVQATGVTATKSVALGSSPGGDFYQVELIDE